MIPLMPLTANATLPAPAKILVTVRIRNGNTLGGKGDGHICNDNKIFSC